MSAQNILLALLGLSGVVNVWLVLKVWILSRGLKGELECHAVTERYYTEALNKLYPRRPSPEEKP